MIYPHVNFGVHNLEDAARLAKKLNRRNLDVTFNLYHFLADIGTEAYEAFIPVVESVIPYLFTISLNGPDEPVENKSGNLWQYFFQPLEREITVPADSSVLLQNKDSKAL
ncbi:hypothetical protein [Autumnicola edwardsiae]|uniref:Xylose isomerase n=1 Tax=Autumnicola edwardsiae TaxID=3075594 RepID=A0ABU3CW96_9FLAO|nr:hypothetical protein [Zunongwangia sp. F297]MDT0650633.1 hypothetical protein [Zunongwangia sp. F297]